MTAALREGRIYAKAPVIKECKGDEMKNADAYRQVSPSTRTVRSGKGGQDTDLVDPNLAAGKRGGEPRRCEPQNGYGRLAGETSREECPQDVGAHFPIGLTTGPRLESANGNRIVCTGGAGTVPPTYLPTGLSGPDRAATAGANTSGAKSASNSYTPNVFINRTNARTSQNSDLLATTQARNGSETHARGHPPPAPQEIQELQQ